MAKAKKKVVKAKKSATVYALIRYNTDFETNENIISIHQTMKGAEKAKKDEYEEYKDYMSFGEENPEEYEPEESEEEYLGQYDIISMPLSA